MSTAPAATLTDAAAQFTDEILQGHREAFAALRQILSTALTAATAKLDSSQSPALPPAQARTLGLALRAAMAILRKKPPEPDDREDTKPYRTPPRPLTREDVLSIAACQRGGGGANGKKDLPFEVVPRLKAWQEYADHMGFSAPFDFPRELLATFPGRPERAPEPEQSPQP
jgi:hypothetical protein